MLLYKTIISNRHSIEIISAKDILFIAYLFDWIIYVYEI